MCDINEELGKKLQIDCEADFFTTDYNKLVKRSEVNAVIIATDETIIMDP